MFVNKIAAAFSTMNSYWLFVSGTTPASVMTVWLMIMCASFPTYYLNELDGYVFRRISF